MRPGRLRFGIFLLTDTWRVKSCILLLLLSFLFLIIIIHYYLLMLTAVAFVGFLLSFVCFPA